MKTYIQGPKGEFTGRYTIPGSDVIHKPIVPPTNFSCSQHHPAPRTFSNDFPVLIPERAPIRGHRITPNPLHVPRLPRKYSQFRDRGKPTSKGRDKRGFSGKGNSQNEKNNSKVNRKTSFMLCLYLHLNSTF
jgi:hypothetical protein